MTCTFASEGEHAVGFIIQSTQVIEATMHNFFTLNENFYHFIDMDWFEWKKQDARPNLHLASAGEASDYSFIQVTGLSVRVL